MKGGLKKTRLKRESRFYYNRSLSEGEKLATAYHMVHYRKVEVENAGEATSTFEEACRSILGEGDGAGISLWNRVGDRIYSSSDHPNLEIILNRVADLTSSVFGEMCLVDTNGLQALLQQKSANVELSNVTVAEIFDLAETAAPNGSKFIRGMVYWLAISDHFFFVRTSSMTPRLIHSFFEWFSVGATSGYPSGSKLVFQAEFNKSQISGDIGDIKKLRVSGAAVPQFDASIVKDENAEISTTKKVADRMVAFSQALPIVEALLGATRTQSLVESLGPKEYLAVDASVRVKGSRTNSSKQKLKELTNELADLTDGKVLVEGKGGKLSDNDAILRMSMPFELVADGASLLDFNNVADQLQEVYNRFVKDGLINS